MVEPLAVFRVDASPEIGGGHAVRCLALADALKLAGWRCAFAGISETVKTVPELLQESYYWWPLNTDTLGEEEPAQLHARARNCNLLVVDHYRRDSQFETACRGWAHQVLVIDDLADRSHNADLLHDPLIGRRAADYAHLIPRSCRMLIGPVYTPLRTQFFQVRHKALSCRLEHKKLDRVMVSLGASDIGNVTAVVLEGLRQVSTELTIDVVMGSSSPHINAVRRLAETLPHHIRMHVGVTDMAALMSLADVAIGAAGTSSWERCALGLPTLLIITAENQYATADALVTCGAVQNLGKGTTITSDRVAEAVQEFAQSPVRRIEMARKAALVCDGRGAARLAMVVAPAWAKDGKPVTLRPTSMDDAAIMLAWQSAPGVRRFSRNPASPTNSEHWDWLAARLETPGCLFSIILHDQDPAGILRLDAIHNASRPTFEISILIAPERQGIGLAHAALILARRLAPEAELVADVYKENEASHALFRGAGFIYHDGAYRLAPSIGQFK